MKAEIRMMRRKFRSELALRPAPGFPAMGPVHYLRYLERLHLQRKPKAYFEIGTESGASLNFAECVSVAVDPRFLIEADVSRNKPELHLFQGTSDAFFESKMLQRLGLKLDLAFLDGMHLFEFLLRDFINTEVSMNRDGLVLMHDCVPQNALMAARDWDRTKTIHWTGDVWKLIPILREYRPDLEVEVLGLAPTGLVAVKNLDAGNTVLRDRYDEIVARFTEVTLESFGLAAFLDCVALKPVTRLPGAGARAKIAPAAAPIAARWEEPAKAAAGSRGIAIKTCVPSPTKNALWGDYHFARGLADAFLRSGHRVRIDSVREWDQGRDETDFSLFLYGNRRFEPLEGVPHLAWLLYPRQVEEELAGELGNAAHVFFGSQPAWESQGPRLGSKGSVLLQSFDPMIMHPGDDAERKGIVFVGGNHFPNGAARPIVDIALLAEVPFRLWGKGWRQHAARRHLQGTYLANGKLGDLYRGAEIVMCDHLPFMRANGYVSNRIFDALACGAAVISDDITGLPADFVPFVHTVSTPDEFAAAVAEIRAESKKKRKARRDFAASMASTHSFDARARQILECAEEMQLP